MECISIHCGHTGIQWGLSCWDLFSSEHNLTPEGKLKVSDSVTSNLCDFSPFFRNEIDGVFKPRALYLDCDDNVLEDPLYGPKILSTDRELRVLGKQQCASIFGQGFRQGKTILDKSLEAVRRLLEESESPQGFIWYHSLGGGTGSGFTTLLSRSIAQEYPELKMHEFSLLPGAEFTCATTDTYNSILGMQNSLDTMGLTYLFDSDVIYKTCFNKLHINDPNHFVLNTVLARLVSDVTATLRFPTIVNGTMEDIEFNLMPHRNLSFPLVCLQPLLHQNAESCDEHFKDLIMSCFEKDHQVLSCDPKKEKIIRSLLTVRGLFDMGEIRDGLDALRKDSDLKFVTSSVKSHTTCLFHSKLMGSSANLITVPRIQVCSVTNSVSIAHIFQNLMRKFDMLYQQRAFLHWYFAEGMEEYDFISAREGIYSLLQNYKQISK